MLTVDEQRQYAYDFLCKLYQKSNGDEVEAIDGSIIFDEIGIKDQKYRHNIILHLHSNHFIKCISMGKDYTSLITKKGILYVSRQSPV